MKTTQKPTKVGVVGCGYWGPNLIRNFRQAADCQLAVLCVSYQIDRSHTSVAQLLSDLVVWDMHVCLSLLEECHEQCEPRRDFRFHGCLRGEWPPVRE